MQQYQAWQSEMSLSQCYGPIVSLCVRKCTAWLPNAFSCFKGDSITTSWSGCSISPLGFSVLSAVAEEAVKEQPVTAGEILLYKSHRRHIVAARGLCWLGFTAVALSCWQARVAVHRWCNTGRKCTAAAVLRASILCARCHSNRKRSRGDALHLPRVTPHTPMQHLSITCDSLCISWCQEFSVSEIMGNKSGHYSGACRSDMSISLKWVGGWKYLPDAGWCGVEFSFMPALMEVENLLAVPSFIKMRKWMQHEEGRG